MQSLKFKPATLPNGATNHTRWREYPTPKRERDGYTIAQYSYDKGWCDPYYVVYFDSEHVDHKRIKYATFEEAVDAAINHKTEG